MTEDELDASGTEGAEVITIDFDAQGNEVWLSPSEAGETASRARVFGIGDGKRHIDRIKHGPLVGAEVDIRAANVGSLARAVGGNYEGTILCVDQSAPPVDEDMLELDDRYILDVRNGQLVAVVTERYLRQPTVTPTEVAESLTRVAAAYGCIVVDVKLTLAGGGTPDDLLIDFSGRLEPEFAAQLRADELKIVAAMAHDVHTIIATDSQSLVGQLIDGATAIADYIKATKHGPLDATGVLNLLRGGHYKGLIGESESNFLEAKATMHPIWLPGDRGDRAKIELAQDIARFANGSVDAVLVVGFKETSKGGPNEIGSVTPVSNDLLEPTRLTTVLDSRIVPPVAGLIIEQFSVTESESLLAIYVPKQPAELQPYLVHGAIAGDKVVGDFFSIVQRRGGDSITTTAHQIHAYIDPA